ncbi:uncharacterized protein [Arachis hypogaea]|uniref:Uncharacterized protein n=1 Tax=Arachis hypogaea TaxID=3818 RepID=A0A445BAR2_ARAHY|nr:uncharacterized protein LOC112714809 isoform X2 [Arachis hypogaea]XP_025622269.1 uncharacterized protein LOC112714809 isoform X2 [Arachis hypogaea]XP_025622270.1 uncharacterized protein LOC112714809 isoform X2 [Arachis hypogaea]QHO15105.1 uncharacterized protein DS421_10g292030 [Arachis hypogaea]RYR35739.1 hypothetical protein Ahy_A10g050859 [Arachis hypogaea]
MVGGGEGAIGPVAMDAGSELQPMGHHAMESVSSPGYRSRPAMAGLHSSMDGGFDKDVAVSCLVPEKNVVGLQVGLVRDGEDFMEDYLTLNGAVIDGGSVGTGFAMDISVGILKNSDGKALEREEQMLKNRRAWKLAVESGAVQYNDEDDIMAILHGQNKALAQKRRLAK